MTVKRRGRRHVHLWGRRRKKDVRGLKQERSRTTPGARPPATPGARTPTAGGPSPWPPRVPGHQQPGFPALPWALPLPALSARPWSPGCLALGPAAAWALARPTPGARPPRPAFSSTTLGCPTLGPRVPGPSCPRTFMSFLALYPPSFALFLP